jgi:WD40-like Beta Propeller Repeat
LSVSPGGVVFFDSAPTVGISPADAQGDQIYSVPIVGGPVHEVSPGFDPAISPDGRTLAFVASNGVGEAPYQLATGGIELAQLNGSEITGVRTLHPSGAMVGAGFSNLSWSADSQTLSFDQLDPSNDVTSTWMLSDPNAQSSLSSAVEIPLHPNGLAWGGFLGESAKGAPLGIGVETAVEEEPPLASSQKVVSIDPQTGAVVRTLFALPAAICTSPSPSTPEDCDADFSSALDVDPASSSVLVSGAIPLTDEQVSTSGLTYLFRWDSRSAKPVRLTSGVVVAAWGPRPGTTSSESR